jgi:hypothetical protein
MTCHFDSTQLDLTYSKKNHEGVTKDGVDTTCTISASIRHRFRGCFSCML